MAQKSNSFERFWKELKRRKVVHVITVYAAVAFVILQLVDMVAEPLRLPVSTKALVIVLLCIGFIIAVFVSWIYDITPAGVKKTKPASTVKHIDQTTTPTSSGWKFATYVSGLIIVVLVALNFISRRSLNSDISKLEKSIAVLPFRNDSRDSTNQYFIDGIMEEILNNLEKIGAFSRVLSRNSVEQFRNNTTKSTPEIAKILGVNYIVEGSGQKYGNKFILRVQLITGKNERHLWAKSYDREIMQTTDIVSVQSEIAQLIAAELKATITPEEKQLIEKTPTANLTALDFYQRGNMEQSKYSFIDTSTWKALVRADEMYKKALEYDPSYAQAYLGMAGVYWSKHYWESYLSKNFLDSVLILAEKALSLDDQLADAYRTKGYYYHAKGLSEQAIKEYDKALRYNSNDYLAYYSKGFVLYDLGDCVQGIRNLHQAVIRNRGADRPVYLRSLGYSYSDIGFWEKAKYYCTEALTLDRDSAIYFLKLAELEFNFENFEEALKLAKRGHEIDTAYRIPMEFYYYVPDSLNYEAYLNAKKYVEYCKRTGILPIGYYYRIGYAFWRVGKQKEAKYYFNQEIQNGEKRMQLDRFEYNKQAYYEVAASYAFLGEKEKAYKYLEEWDKRNTKYPIWWVVFIRHDQYFDSFRNEERFQKIQKSVEAKYQAEHERVKKWLEEQGML
jgi:TolB-like protein/Tfp pilus assembly protein PilF